MKRRSFLRSAAHGAFASALLKIAPTELRAAPANGPLIIDTHQHLWDLSFQKLPWLDGVPKILNRSYTPESDKKSLLATFPQLARAVSSRGALNASYL